MLLLVLLIKRAGAFLAVLLLVVGLTAPVFVAPKVSAGLVTNRSLTLSSSANGNTSTNALGTDVCALTTFANPQGGCGAKAKHTVTFTMATDVTVTTVGSILIIYCTSPILQTSCTTPTGLTAQNLTSVTVTGLSGTQTFSLDTTTLNSTINTNIGSGQGTCLDVDGGTDEATRQNCVALNRATAITESTANPTVSVAYGGGTSDYIKNPTSDNYSFYARLLIFSDTAYDTIVDYGGLAASTAQQVDILAKVQEQLFFSVGAVSKPRVGSACTPHDDPNPSLELGDTNSVLSTLQAYDKHSYFRLNTNTVNGTKVFYSGDTLKSSASGPDIDPMPVAIAGPPQQGTQSQPGTEQFGLAIDQSDTDPNGTPGDGDGYDFTDMTKTAPYHEGHGTITNLGSARFVFLTSSITTPVEIASSSGGIACATGSVRYVANVSTSTPAGIYRTTITYIAVGTY